MSLMSICRNCGQQVTKPWCNDSISTEDLIKYAVGRGTFECPDCATEMFDQDDFIFALAEKIDSKYPTVVEE